MKDRNRARAAALIALAQGVVLDAITQMEMAHAMDVQIAQERLNLFLDRTNWLRAQAEPQKVTS